MAILKKRGEFRTYKVLMDDDEVTFKFRHPEDEELNVFLGSRIKFSGPDPVDASDQARLKFFKVLFDSVDNLTTEDGNRVTVDDLMAKGSGIEKDILAKIIMELFETPNFTVLEKN